MTSGACFCGQIRFEIAGGVEDVIHCHCSQCRRLSGAAFTTWVSIRRENFSWICRGVDVTYVVGDFSTRHFCATCGTHVFTEDTRQPEIVGVPAGVLGDGLSVQARAHYFVDHRAAWVDWSGELPKFDGESGLNPVASSSEES